MGWQRQAHGPSVQQAIEEAVTAVTQTVATVHAAGRTDAGVHAEAMAAHLDLARPITPFRLMEALNARLRPAPVAILACQAVPDDWHARFSCVARRYRYRIVNRRAPLALEEGRAWQVAVPLDADAMDAAARVLEGRHDFTTFRSAHCQADSPVRTLDRLRVRAVPDAHPNPAHPEPVEGCFEPVGPTLRQAQGERIQRSSPPQVIEIEAAARSFLHHQVRSMVGCLVLVGRGKWRAADLAAALAARDRAALGLNAPPDGLYFVEASY